MVFSRRFPRDVKGSPYPVWEEVYLSAEEEAKLEEEQRTRNLVLFRECVEDARKLLAKDNAGLPELIQTAIAFFEKRSSHSVYWKEEAVKEKFDRAYGRG